ncbi:hypothetical protein [Aureimonas pseudogalii]|uniref:Uncharacterized protein n=1 Tax=Aureimonas pseudogalii TaxID=1744844 RepID=A0A7W6H3J2_9HYPH|nr:hypothetical protein [Aureimonas pseudogalii]MBB3997232.1 hypothetical protein [Aureimonas pseudogalii]
MSKKPKVAKKLPVSMDPARLSEPAERLFSRIILGQRMTVHFVKDDRIPRGKVYLLEPDGIRCDPQYAEEIIRKGRVKPRGDTLFAGEACQSYEFDPHPVAPVRDAAA